MRKIPAVKRVDKLTPEQEAQMKFWAEKWIKIGLSTERADRPKFEAAVRECYRAAGLPEPKVIVWVSSPIVGAFAAPYAQWVLNKINNRVGNAVGGAVRNAVDDAVGNAVDGAVAGAVRSAVGNAVDDAVDDAVRSAVGNAVSDAVRSAVGNAVGGAVRSAVGNAVGGAVSDAVAGAVRGAVGNAVDDAVGSAVRSAVRSAVGGAVGNAVSDAVGGAVRSAVGNAVSDAVDDAVGGAVSDAVAGAVSDAVAGAVRGAVGNAVGGAVSDAVAGAVRGAVGNAVDDAVGGAVRSAVGNAVSDAVGGAVRSAVGNAVSDAVGGAVGGAREALIYIRDRKYQRMGGQFWVGWGYWYGSPSMASFFQDVTGLDLGEDMNKRARAYQATAESACWWWAYSDFVMVCERPEVIHIENNQLHNDQEMAIRWPDGWGLHFLRGMLFEKDMWQKISDQTITAEEVMKIDDIDKRTIAVSMLAPGEMLKQLKAKLVHTGIKGNRLYKCENFMDTGKTEYALVMTDASTPREFIKFTPPEVGKQGDADFATACGYKDAEGNNLPLEDYLLMEQEA